MSRFVARSTQILLDLLVLGAALWIAFLVRFDWVLPLQMLKRAAFLWPYVIAFQYVVLRFFGVHRFAWRYVGIREGKRVFQATLAASSVLVVLRLAAAWLLPINAYAQYALIPMGVIAADWGLSFLGVAGIRVLRRIRAEQFESRERRQGVKRQLITLLVGAGQAGVMVAKELETRPDLGLRAVGFLDDDPHKEGTVVNGLPVLGTTDRLEAISKKYGAEQVLITIANAPGKDIRRLKELCDRARIPAKIIPGVYEIVGGQVNLSRIRNVTIEDLLGREPVKLEMAEISGSLAGKVVLISGAGGSIGSELCRQVLGFSPKRLILLEQAENSLFHVHRELVASHPELAARIIPCIGDICDAARMQAVFGRHRPQMVFHAAAHKHVPMMEWNPGEAVKNNIFGTRMLADVAHAHRVAEFVMISSDKAVNPTSVMGTTKRVAEIYLQGLSQRSETRFVTVRFGNVLGSAGSVIPIFQEQIARGGPVTVTHPDMQRYFMTIPEACQLVLQAGAMGRGGEIFILDMGEPMKIVDLARDLVRLSGLRPDEDVEIQFTGLRPGEKLFEELSVAGEYADKTRHPKIYVGRIAPHDWDEVAVQLSMLRVHADAGDEDRLREQLKRLVPEYVVPNSPALAEQPGEPPVAARLALAGGST